MNKNYFDLVRIVEAGAGLRLNSGDCAREDLVHLAEIASRKNVQIIITGSDKCSTEDLIRIASAGKGSIMFE